MAVYAIGSVVQMDLDGWKSQMGENCISGSFYRLGIIEKCENYWQLRGLSILFDFRSYSIDSRDGCNKYSK